MVRERVREKRNSAGGKLIDVPGYTFRIFVTSCNLPPLEVWREYNRRADMENRIEELKNDLGAGPYPPVNDSAAACHVLPEEQALLRISRTWACGPDGGGRLPAENTRDEQRKMIKYHHPVANLLIFHNVVAMTKRCRRSSPTGWRSTRLPWRV